MSHRQTTAGALLALLLALQGPAASAKPARGDADDPPSAASPADAARGGKGAAGKGPAGKAAAAPTGGGKAAKVVKVPPAQAAQALAGSNPAAAVAGARSLGQQKGAPALAALLDALALGVAPDVAEAALLALGDIGDVKAFDTLVVYREHRAPKVRAAAVLALGAVDDQRADKLVIDALSDGHVTVRAAAARIAGERRLKKATKELMALLKGGDEAAAPALAQLADPELAKDVAELIGQAPDGLVARCLGAILAKPDFKPEIARVEVVRALGKLPGDDAIEQLTSYVASIPENPPRQSRREAEALIEAKLGGGK